MQAALEETINAIIETARQSQGYKTIFILNSTEYKFILLLYLKITIYKHDNYNI